METILFLKMMNGESKNINNFAFLISDNYSLWGSFLAQVFHGLDVYQPQRTNCNFADLRQDFELAAIILVKRTCKIQNYELNFKKQSKFNSLFVY